MELQNKALKEIINDYRQNNMEETYSLSDDEVLKMYPVKDVDVKIYILGKSLERVTRKMQELIEENDLIRETLKEQGVSSNERSDLFNDLRDNNYRINELRTEFYDIKKRLLEVNLDERANNR